MGRLLKIVACVFLASCRGGADTEGLTDAGTGLKYLGGDAQAGFERALVPRVLSFPSDHGDHPSFRTEWWYFTGNVETRAGRHFGFELTFFRYGLSPAEAQSSGASAWRARQVWMAHFAVTDTAGGQFTAVERLARESLGLAGATAEPLHVWVKDWSARGSSSETSLVLHLDAQDEKVGMQLDLSAALPPVTHGDRGLDRKGATEGNASFYYSVPRLATRGTLRVDEEEFEVEGLAWLDREWGTSALEPGIVGWDWIALHLSDGRSLMFYRLRNSAGGASPFSGGSLIEPDGSRTALGAEDVQITATREWMSGATGARYPVAWRLTAERIGVDLTIEPYLDEQEVDLGVRYWEGAVSGEGTAAGKTLLAQGYLELAGY